MIYVESDGVNGDEVSENTMFFHGSVAQLVRAPSLYLGGPWFDSKRTHHMTYTICMFFLPAICFVLGISFLLFARQHHYEKHIVGLAVSLLFGALGTGIITFFALHALT